VSAGVNVAVIVDVPAPLNVSVVPDIVATLVFDEVYVNVPGVEELGALIVAAVSPKVAVIGLNAPRIGVALLTVTTMVVVVVV